MVLEVIFCLDIEVIIVLALLIERIPPPPNDIKGQRICSSDPHPKDFRNLLYRI